MDRYINKERLFPSEKPRQRGKLKMDGGKRFRGIRGFFAISQVFLLVIAGLAALVIVESGDSSGTVLFVGSSSTYSSISQAIENATSGDLIRIDMLELAGVLGNNLLDNLIEFLVVLPLGSDLLLHNPIILARKFGLLGHLHQLLNEPIPPKQ